MTPIKAIIYLEKLAQWLEARASNSQEDSEIQAYCANARGARNIAKMIKEFNQS